MLNFFSNIANVSVAFKKTIYLRNAYFLCWQLESYLYVLDAAHIFKWSEEKTFYTG